jgi:hypothetical protein
VATPVNCGSQTGRGHSEVLSGTFYSKYLKRELIATDLVAFLALFYFLQNWLILKKGIKSAVDTWLSASLH